MLGGSGMDYCGKNIVTSGFNNKNQSIHKERWVYIAKGLAILAVMTDHSRNILYSNDRIQRLSYFSVSLFIIIMGVTTYWSYNNSRISLRKKVITRLWGILLPYFVANFLAYCLFNCSFNWDAYCYYALHFNIAGPYYYVLLYIQLVLISPVLFIVVKKLETFSKTKKIVIEILVGLLLILFARISNDYTDIIGVNAGRLLGGSYLLCFYGGILVGANSDKIKKIPTIIRKIYGMICIIAMLSMGYALVSLGYIFDKPRLLGTDINPPGITLMLYAFTIVLSFFAWSVEVEIYKLFRLLDFLGKHTLYIFLYHILIMSKLNILTANWLVWIRVPVYYITMIGVSICIEKILAHCKKIIIEGYSYGKEC